ncbi:hypothetical protein X275_07180 [Marinitoga sp. 1197]|uniref:hypothetical protein n=1 Tax=unclassified Marinitoga TaxID=2640159 RepID=UPI0006411CF2|nr:MULTISPECIES: hypothetical protein [unclassified Marinitoga]KLO22112.1 hypothetical protein X275_07180 [Marinitoga sp. 1197]KLO24692.1 hypothetical protein X274_03065 [Marinitoga sp. 1155]NUU98824.1 hypothetical protein [Marinitoga sp. 1154]
MKNKKNNFKKNILIFIGILSIFMAIINFKYDNFIFVSYIIVSLIAFIGLWEDIKNVWYHFSAHIIVSGIISLLIGTYELLKYIFGWLAVYTSGNDIPDFKISIYLFSFLMLYVLYKETNFLKKEGYNK